MLMISLFSPLSLKLNNEFNFHFVDDVDLPDGISVFVRDHDCADLVEKLYYSCNYELICLYCGFYFENADEDTDTYPQCVDCDGEAKKLRSVLEPT